MASLFKSIQIGNLNLTVSRNAAIRYTVCYIYKLLRDLLFYTYALHSEGNLLCCKKSNYKHQCYYGINWIGQRKFSYHDVFIRIRRNIPHT